MAKKRRRTSLTSTKDFKKVGFSILWDETMVYAFNKIRTSDNSSSETKLFRAVLLDAFEAIESYKTSPTERNRKSSDEAVWWFRKRDVETIFDLDPLCEILGIDAESVRKIAEGKLEK